MSGRADTNDVRMNYELVVGLEVHCQLRTESKIFCGCSTLFGAPPNTNTCPVCLGLPGALPTLNRKVVELATRAALAMDCTVHERSVFARKNYFYPDLPKGYQISQFDQPLATRGVITIGAAPDTRAIGITRVHIEEDAGKLVHDRIAGFTAVDLNRAGTPLIEIVSEPDLRSAADAVLYLRALKQLLEYTEVSDANMEEGSLRVDVNISARPRGALTYGTRTEIKNLNTFSGVERAIELEFARQCETLASGAVIVQQTMLWDGVRNAVRPARSKESSHDYRYFADPDLPPLQLDPQFIRSQRENLPELPHATRARMMAKYQLPVAETEQLTSNRALTRYFEATVPFADSPKRVANWLVGAVLASLNTSGLSIDQYPVAPEQLGALLQLEASGEVSNTAAKQILGILEQEGGDARSIAAREKLLQVGDDAALGEWIDAVMTEHPLETARFIGGETKLQGVLVGWVMKKSGGRADPRRVNHLLARRLSS